MGNKQASNQRAWVGIALVIFGIYFLTRNLHLIPDFIPYYLFGWETIFVVVGGSMLITGRREGLVFLAIGIFFLIPEIFYLPNFRFRDWWPVILILIGVTIVLRRRDDSTKGQIEANDDFIEDTSIFGGSEKTFTSDNFKGGKITSIFGGSDIDLSHTQMHGNEIVINIFCFFGGNGIRVPNDWTVINESVVLFGGFGDKRHNVIPADGAPKILRIKGSVIFGGAEIKGS